MPDYSPAKSTAKSTVSLEISIEEPRWKSEFPELETLLREAVDNSGVVLTGKMSKSIEDTEISVLLSNNDTIQSLNKNYRNKDKPTNILSFPMSAQGDDAPIIEDDKRPHCLGDLALALDVILQEARDQGKVPQDHLQHLIVHGFLHLLGYDHEDDSEAQAMEALEIKILARIGIKNPYE